MGHPEPDLKEYYEQLNTMLQNIRTEIESVSRLPIPWSDNDKYDEYLLELNTYYYQSFHNKFFPVYKTSIEKDISKIYGLSMQESTLKKDIVINIARYAQLYNRVKNIISTLSSTQAMPDNNLSALNKGRDLTDFLFIIQESKDNLDSLLSRLKNLAVILDDQQLLTAVDKYHFPPFIIPTGDKGRITRDFNRIISGLQIDINLLVKLQLKSDVNLDARTIIKQIEQSNAEFLDKKISTYLRNWYTLNVHKQFSFYIELSSLYLDKNDNKRMLKTVQLFEDWLRMLLYFLQQSKYYGQQEQSSLTYYINLLPDIDRSHINKLLEHVSAFSQQLGDLITSLAASSHAVFEHYCEQGVQVLEELHQYLLIQINDEKTQRIPLIGDSLTLLNKQIILFDSQVEVLNERIIANQRVEQRYQTVQDLLISYMDLLGTIKAELETVLNPHHIKRSYKEINVRLEHIPVIKGELFPKDFLYLLNNSAAATLPPSKQEFTVIEEYGDIFLISVDDIKEEIIPEILLASKA